MAEQAAPIAQAKINTQNQEQMLSTLEASMATTKRGPRVDEKTMKIVPRSLLGDPEEFQIMLRQQTAARNPSTPGSENLASPTSAKTGRARFASGVSAITLPTSASENMDQSNMSPGLNTSMYYEQQENMDKETELRKSLKVLEETKRREREERHKKIKAMHIFQRFDQVKEQRILTRHEKRQAEWEAFRARMAKRLNKDPDDLVINRAEEFRMMLEEKDILGKVVPIEKRHGANLWQMSLRDAWTRYLTVGSIFSGLEMPFVDKPDLRPELITYIRQPFKESNIVLNKTRKSRADVPDEVPYVDEYKKQYSKSLSVLQPHEPELASIYIQGVGLEREYNQKLQETIRLKEEEEEKRRKEEEWQARRASRMPTYLSRSSLNGTDAASLSARSYATTVQPTEAANTGIEPEKWEPDVEAPAMHFGSSRLLCHTVKEEVAEVRLGCMNVGNTAVYYKWTRKQLGVDSAKDGVQRVFQQDMSGSILPGANKEFVFTFKSDKAGIYSEEWRFEGRPLVEATEHVVVIKGVALEEDLGKTKREELEMRIGASLKEHAVSDFVDELVGHIGTPRSRSRVLVEDPDVDRQVFIAQNKEAQIYYSNTTLKLFRSLADSTFELLNFPMELRKWDSSLESLKRLLYAIEDDYERERHIVQFNDIMKVAGIPPTSTSMFNSICYELVAELADGIPDIADGIRKKLDLPPKHLEFKEKAERNLVYTTGPELSIWRYDTHLLRIGGPPIEYADQEKNPGVVKLEKKMQVEIWAPEGQEEEEGKEEDAEGEEKKVKVINEDVARLEFEYLLRLNDAIYYKFACLTEKMALLNTEADLRSQVIAQVVMELNAAAAEEIRMLINEEKEDEARKLDPQKYQNIVDLDEIFRRVKKEEEVKQQKTPRPGGEAKAPILSEPQEVA